MRVIGRAKVGQVEDAAHWPCAMKMERRAAVNGCGRQRCESKVRKGLPAPGWRLGGIEYSQVVAVTSRRPLCWYSIQ